MMLQNTMDDLPLSMQERYWQSPHLADVMMDHNIIIPHLQLRNLSWSVWSARI